MFRVLLYDPLGKVSEDFLNDERISVKSTAEDALVFIKTCAPSAVAVCSDERKEKREHFIKAVKMTTSVPIIAVCSEEDAIFFYNSGADGVFCGNSRELFLYEAELAYKRGLAQGFSKTRTEMRFGDLFISLSAYKCVVGEKEVKMPRKELETLFLLASEPETVFSRNDILDEVWGVDYIGDPRTVDVHILRIREKIKGSRAEIKTVPRAGYMFTYL